MVKALSYEKIMKYVPKDFNTFVADGLSPGQAISRVIVEYEIQTDDYEEVRWMLTVLLAEIGARCNCMRKEIQEEALAIINDKRLLLMWKQTGISDSEISSRSVHLEKVKSTVLGMGEIQPSR